MDITSEIQFRSHECGLGESVLKAVYLREMRDRPAAGSERQQAALRRVDEFIVYALVRDARYSTDRDLLEFVSTT